MIAAILTIALCIFVFLKNREKGVNRSFAIFLLCIASYNINIFGIRMAPTEDFAELWGKIFRIGLLFIPPTFLHFVISFGYSNKLPSSKYRLILKIAYLASVAFAVFNLTPYFTSDAVKYKWGYSVQSGPIYPYFIGTFLVFMLLGVALLVENYLKSDPYQKQRIRYFILALIVTFIFGISNFLPMFGFEVYPLGNIAILLGSLILSYTIVQNRLIDVSIFLAKGLGYVLSILTLAVPGTIAMVSLEKFYFQRIDANFSILLVIFGIIAACLFNFIRQKIDRQLRKIIIRDKYLYHKVLEDFSRRLVTIVDLGRLLNNLADTIEQSMGISRISIFLYSPEKENFQLRLNHGGKEDFLKNISYQKDSTFIQFLERKEEVILRPEIENLAKGDNRDSLLKELEILKAEVCLPLIYLDRLNGFISLGSKASEDMFYREDLDLLGSLANQIAIAIENANLYENLKKSQLMMRRTDRLASLGTLIAGLAHEIRNPLVSIKTFTQLLPERMDDEEFRNYFLTVASGEIDRLTTLINELLGFAKPTEPNLKGEDVNSIIDKMEFLISTEAKKKNITITKNYSPTLPPVMADAEQIKQVLLNILLNGMQAIEGDQGQVWIETRVVRVAREDGINPFVQIEIRDNGAGISKENLDHIFDPFFTTRAEGSGLGLAITYQIVHEHGGFIDVESEIGKGTSFQVNFPLKAGENGGSKPQ